MFRRRGSTAVTHGPCLSFVLVASVAHTKISTFMHSTTLFPSFPMAPMLTETQRSCTQRLMSLARLDNDGVAQIADTTTRTVQRQRKNLRSHWKCRYL